MRTLTLQTRKERFVAATMNVSRAVTSLDHNNCNMVTSMVAHSGPARKTSGRKRIVITGSQWNHGMIGSHWHDVEGYGNELHSKETDWNENCCETDDYDTTDDLFQKTLLHCWSKLSKHEGDVNELETVQEAVAAANAAAETHLDPRHTAHERRRTDRVVTFPVLQGDQVMEVDHCRGKSRGQKGRSFGCNRSAKERARARAKGDALARVFCVKVLLGPVIVFHSMVAKGRCVVSSGKGSESSSPFSTSMFGRRHT